MRQTIVEAAVIGSIFFSSISFSAGPKYAGYLIHRDGRVELKREPWENFQPAEVGTFLKESDQLRLGSSAEATVLCTDFETVWRPTRGLRSRVSEQCKTKLGRLLQSPRGFYVRPKGIEPDSPIGRIRSPRGAIREPGPMVRWEISASQQVKVRVILDSKEIWESESTTGTAQRMPPGLLEPGLPYNLEVVGSEGTKLIAAEKPFYLLSIEARSEISKGEYELLDIFSKGSLAHVLYLTHNYLLDEALSMLDALQPELESAPVHLLGASLSRRIGLRQEAIQRYQKARSLAGEHDLESAATALAALARMNANRDSAMEAIAKYLALGDDGTAAELCQEFDRYLRATTYSSCPNYRSSKADSCPSQSP